jgi:hypothetical protein
MLRTPFISLASTKKAFTSFILIGLAVFALASMGGGGNKTKNKSIKADLTPIRTTNGFTLKAGPNYHGSMIFGQEKTKDVISFNSVITYQRGNTTYILPYKYKLQTSSFQSRSSLQMFNLKLKIHK